MFLRIDPKTGSPIYLQIIEQVKYQTVSGRLQVGDRLPTVRDLAVMLRVNPNTVAKAYRELEREGILEGRPGQGSFISGRGAGLSQARCFEMISRLMERPVVEAYHLKLDRRDVEEIFQSKLSDIYADREKWSDSQKEGKGE
jgi:GntR family transcriptional regulator